MGPGDCPPPPHASSYVVLCWIQIGIQETVLLASSVVHQKLAQRILATALRPTDHHLHHGNGHGRHSAAAVTDHEARVNRND